MKASKIPSKKPLYMRFFVTLKVVLIGIDEVGRGCWAGPLVAAAVELTEDVNIPGLKDSKKLTSNKRQNLSKQIRQQAFQFGLGWVWPEEIANLGLSLSVATAMERALAKLDFKGRHIVIDGNVNYLSNFSEARGLTIETIIKADSTIPAVSAASIIAKVARDSYMKSIAKQYPKYGFDTHVGYGTKIHLAALQQWGVLPIHRSNYKPIREVLLAQQ